MIEKFIQFLKEQGVYDQFLANLNEDLHEFLNYTSPDMYLLKAFRWDETPEEEGGEFWRQINCKWSEIW